MVGYGLIIMFSRIWVNNYVFQDMIMFSRIWVNNYVFQDMG